MTVSKKSIPIVFRKTVKKFCSRTAMRQKKLGIWNELTWNQYYERSMYISSALLELGCKPGDKISILGDNCPEWLLADMGIQYIGCVSTGIYSTNSWQKCQYIIEHSESVLLFAENEEQLDKWLEFNDEIPELRKVIVWDLKGLRDFNHPDYMTFNQLLELGKEKFDKNKKKIETNADSINADDAAILVYTSGTTGRPKGAVLTHGGLTWMAVISTSLDPAFIIDEHDEIMSFLPLCHIFERLFSFYGHIQNGYIVNFVESLETIPDNLREIAPTIGYGVPRIWEKFYSSIMIRMSEATWFKRFVFNTGLKISKKASNMQLDGQPASIFLKVGQKFFDLILFGKLRKRLGMNQMKVAYSGAAPIAPDVLRFFHAIGLKLLEGYGQTESGGVSTFTTIKDFKIGTVGKKLPGAELRLSEDGEILFRSPGLFKGYYKNKEATSQALKNGWLHSGDIGELDDDGYLKIVDRKKDLIITAGGKNIAPQHIENKLKFSPYINDAIIIGEGRKFISALIVLDEDNIVKYTQTHKIPFRSYSDLARNEDIRELIQREVDNVNKELARVESVRKFTILPKRFYQEDGEVTPTMKVKRRKIRELYKQEIEKIYQ